MLQQVLLPTFSSSLSDRLLLPLAQRLVSIEVQDDYLQLKKIDRRMNNVSSSASSASSSSSPSWWDDFVDKTWTLFFQNYHERQANNKGSISSSSTEQERLAELQAQQLYTAKQKKRQERARQRVKGSNLTGKQEDNGGSYGASNIDDYHNQQLLEQLGNHRVQLLERYIRPGLLSTLRDLHRPLFTMRHNSEQQQQPSSTHDNFVKWLRGEYLIAKYGLIVQNAVMEHPELRGDHDSGDINHINGGGSIRHRLPSVQTVIQAFGMQHWSRHKVPIPLEEEKEDDDINLTTNICSEHIIHKLGRQITHAGPLNAYFEMRRLWGRRRLRRGSGSGGGQDTCYELWTREYIFGLAQYLLDRVAEMDRMHHNRYGDGQIPMETIILDVGAGDGRLSYFLRCAMEEIHVGIPPEETNSCIAENDVSLTTSSTSVQSSTLPTIIATDDGSWNPMDRYNIMPRLPSSNSAEIHVERLSAIESLRKYGPTRENYRTRRLIVLCSWMPPGQDWTADFRRRIDVDDNTITSEVEDRCDDMDDCTLTVERVVEEYILIGEADNGTCGHNWRTWGNPDFYQHDNTADDDIAAPYSRDGYKRVDLKELSALQFSRFDCQRSSESQTVSFRRC